MRVALRWLATLALASMTQASIRLYVDASAAPGGSGFSWNSPFQDLQTAFQFAATHGGVSAVNEIWVRAGTYVPTTNVNDPTARFELTTASSLYGGFAGGETQLSQRDPSVNITILSGDLLGDDGPAFANRSENSFNILRVSGTVITRATVIDGFVVRGGNALGFGGGAGAGVRVENASPTFRNCLFTDNQGTGAPALWTGGAHIGVERCRFVENKAWSAGGALSISNVTSTYSDVIDCDFIGNTAPTNGALGIGPRANLLRCRFIGNSATQGDTGALGISPPARVVDCVFLGNSCTSFGGAVYTSGSSSGSGNHVDFVNCLFAHNSSGVAGGALFLYESFGVGPYLTNCTIADNSAAQSGGGVRMRSTSSSVATLPILWNCIVSGNVDASGTGESAQLSVQLATPTVNNSCIQGWTGTFPGSWTFDGAPEFANAFGCDTVPGTLDDDFHLPPNSICADVGDPYALPTDVLDLDLDGNVVEVLPLDLAGIPRVVGGGVDLGAYEVQPDLVQPYCFGDGTGTPCPCGNSGAGCRGCANSANPAGALLESLGATNPDTLVLRASGMPTSASSIFLKGDADAAAPIVFGDGLRCVSGSLVRLGAKPGGTGSAEFPESGNPSVSVRGGTPPGSGFYACYQTYYRNASGAFCPPETFNVTNGLRVIW